jgi:adenosylcobyric acid synthase
MTGVPGRGLLVAGTQSDVGKSVITAGICRWLRRRGVSVAPFKAQNMSNNSAVAGGPAGAAGEIGRAQALQAAACGLAPDVRFNPVLLKPGSDHTSQVVVRGQVTGHLGADDFAHMRPTLAAAAFDTLAELRRAYDVVVCEGAGGAAEINLRRHDFVNLGLARTARLPTVVVGDIDRGGVFASLFGTLALLDATDQEWVAGFIINRFRGSIGLLNPGLAQLRALTGRPTYGVVPFHTDIWLDGEDSLAYDRVVGRPAPPYGDQWLRVTAVRLPRLSNATDLEALATEPGVRVTLTTEPAELDSADLVVLPGSKSTVDDLDWLRRTGLADAVVRHAAACRPVLGLCGGFQMLAEHIEDDVESRRGSVSALGLLPIRVTFDPRKTLARAVGRSADPRLGDTEVRGYEIHHGRVTHADPVVRPLLRHLDGTPEGAGHGHIFGTHWHGAFESDAFRRAFLSEVARLAGRSGFRPAPDIRYRERREGMLELLADLVETHLDTDALWRLIESGPPEGLPFIASGQVSSPKESRCR